MDDLQFYVLFDSISVISKLWVGENERRYAVETHLLLKRSLPQAELKPGTAKSAG